MKDAIVDQFRERTGRRPSVELKQPDMRFNLHIFDEDCTLSLDSSGRSLHKRGYRKSKLAAPINEVLAAGMLKLAGWNGDRPLFDPMCGSGTIPIEAAYLACNIPPQWQNLELGFKNWKDFDEDLWKDVLAVAEKNIRDTETPIFAFDMQDDAIRATRQNLWVAKLEDKIQLSQARFEEIEKPSPKGVMVFNPPYGERLSQDDVQAFYGMIGDTMKQKYSGWEAWIISGSFAGMKRIGLRPSKKYTLYNGALECKFQKFEMYEGSRKAKKQDQKR